MPPKSQTRRLPPMAEGVPSPGAEALQQRVRSLEARVRELQAENQDLRRELQRHTQARQHTPLFLACELGHTRVVSRLLAANASVYAAASDGSRRRGELAGGTG